MSRWWRLLSHGAPDSPTVRCASHVTRPLGFDHWSFCLRGHRTGPVDCPVRRLARALTSARAAAHCSAFNVLCRRPLARSSRCSAGTPDSPVLHRIVRWIIAERLPEFPKVSSSELSSLVHRTGAPDSPMRQTRTHFGCLLLSLFELFLGLFIGLLWTFGTCRTYNLEQTS
jgi:hypothetical protein